jgi:putative ABC transport system ATP-binding protein
MLRLKQVTKSFRLPYGTIIKAVDKLSLSIAKTDFAVVVGPNGAGKSTLFDLISGRSYVDSGQIFFNNMDITFRPAHKRSRYITLISQLRGAGLPRAMTVREAIRLALEAGRRPLGTSIDKCISERLEVLEPGLSRLLTNQIWHLSGGEYQLVALSVATILCEQSTDGLHIILLDEHVSQLAPKARDRVLRATTDLVNRQHLTALLATHSPVIATSLGNRQIVIANGRVVIDRSGADRINDVKDFREILLEVENNPKII